MANQKAQMGSLHNLLSFGKREIIIVLLYEGNVTDEVGRVLTKLMSLGCSRCQWLYLRLVTVRHSMHKVTWYALNIRYDLSPLSPHHRP